MQCDEFCFAEVLKTKFKSDFFVVKNWWSGYNADSKQSGRSCVENAE
jgi:hypothetical protein